MLRCRDGSLYTGSTNDLAKRLAAHRAGTGARYTRARLPVRLVYREARASRGSALRREAAIAPAADGEARAVAGRAMSLRRRDIIGAVFALVVAALCVRLGFGSWPAWVCAVPATSRSARRATNHRSSCARDVTVDEAHDRRIHARGVYDWTHERVWPGRTWEGAPGWPCSPVAARRRLGGVRRSRLRPIADARHVDHAVWREPDSAGVVGLGVAAPRDRGDVNPTALGDSLPYPVLPFVVQLLPAESAAVRPTPLRWPAPTLDDGPHLSYAIQWFSFAVIILVGTGSLLRKNYVEQRRQADA
jgi:putative endonuclease